MRTYNKQLLFMAKNNIVCWGWNYLWHQFPHPVTEIIKQSTVIGACNL